MSYQLERRDNQWLVINEDGSTEGSHDARTDAIKHQRALYAREAMVASMYADLDARTEEYVANPLSEEFKAEIEAPRTSPVMAEILALLARDQQDKSLVASVAEQQSLISQQFVEAQQERQALVAALGRMGSPTINLPAAEVNVHVPQAQVDVHVPAAEVTVNVPDVNVSVEAPQVTVRPEIVLPSARSRRTESQVRMVARANGAVPAAGPEALTVTVSREEARSTAVPAARQAEPPLVRHATEGRAARHRFIPTATVPLVVWLP